LFLVIGLGLVVWVLSPNTSPSLFLHLVARTPVWCVILVRMNDQ
jgi:hypothetical protein